MFEYLTGVDLLPPGYQVGDPATAGGTFLGFKQFRHDRFRRSCETMQDPTCLDWVIPGFRIHTWGKLDGATPTR